MAGPVEPVFHLDRRSEALEVERSDQHVVPQHFENARIGLRDLDENSVRGARVDQDELYIARARDCAVAWIAARKVKPTGRKT